MKYLKKTPLIISFLSFITFITSVNADVKVVASIKPIHSLASYLMDGVGKPDLIVDGYASPHGFAMKPSHAKMLQEADLIFWVGEDLEAFLEKPLKSIAKKAEKIELMATKNLNVLKFRERNIFDEHDHDDHGHDDHAKKKDDHDDHDDHDHDKKAKKDDDHDHDHETTKKKDDHDHDHDSHAKKEDGHDDHDDHDGHHHGEFDPHIWLDPINAKAILNVKPNGNEISYAAKVNFSLNPKNIITFNLDFKEFDYNNFFSLFQYQPSKYQKVNFDFSRSGILDKQLIFHLGIHLGLSPFHQILHSPVQLISILQELFWVSYHLFLTF